MKKFLITLMFLCACQSTHDIERLQIEERKLQNVIRVLLDETRFLEQRHAEAEEKVKKEQERYSFLHTEAARLESEIIAKHDKLNEKPVIGCKIPEVKTEDRKVYIITVKIKQSSWSLNPLTHLKNHLNAFEQDIPVDKDFYTSHGVGSEFGSNFRIGSALLHGAAGSVNLKVSAKRIESY